MDSNSDDRGSSAGPSLGPIIDYSDWVPIETLEAQQIESATAVDALETIDLDGQVYARFVARSSEKTSAIVWRSVRETCLKFGISSRCVAQRVERGEFQKRYMSGQEEFAIVPGVETRAPLVAETITAVPDILEGKE